MLSASTNNYPRFVAARALVHQRRPRTSTVSPFLGPNPRTWPKDDPDVLVSGDVLRQFSGIFFTYKERIILIWFRLFSTLDFIIFFNFFLRVFAFLYSEILFYNITIRIFRFSSKETNTCVNMKYFMLHLFNFFCYTFLLLNYCYALWWCTCRCLTC